MRILYSHRVQSHDGQGVHIEELVKALGQAGNEVLVVGPGVYRKTQLGGESALVSAFRRALPGALLESAEIQYNLPAYWRLRSAYARFQPDCVYERYNLYHLAGTLLKSRTGVPLYLEVNAPLAEERHRFGDLRFLRLAKALENRVWRSADRIFVVTEVLKDIVTSAGVKRERVTVIPNAVDRDRYARMAPYQARAGKPVTIGFIGFIRDWHGLEGVITGLADPSAPPVNLIIAGDGPARYSLERQTQALSVDKSVRFIGIQQRCRVPDLIRSFDIALQPKAVSYASPLKIFEYMACGRAIVAPDQPNIREILSDGETAMLFDPQDPRALWAAIRRLAADSRLRERLGRGARLALEARDYTWQANATRVTSEMARDWAHSSACVGA